eukprot:352639-Chlamydomonas_euryale.AAC.1
MASATPAAFSAVLSAFANTWFSMDPTNGTPSFQPAAVAPSPVFARCPPHIQPTISRLFSEWPNDALEAVALKFLKDVDIKAEQRTHIMSICKTFHQNVRDLSAQYAKDAGRVNYVTPTSYLELITAFTTLLASKRNE